MIFVFLSCLYVNFMREHFFLLLLKLTPQKMCMYAEWVDSLADWLCTMHAVQDSKISMNQNKRSKSHIIRWPIDVMPYLQNGVSNHRNKYRFYHSIGTA